MKTVEEIKEFMFQIYPLYKIVIDQRDHKDLYKLTTISITTITEGYPIFNNEIKEKIKSFFKYSTVDHVRSVRKSQDYSKLDYYTLDVMIETPIMNIDHVCTLAIQDAKQALESLEYIRREFPHIGAWFGYIKRLKDTLDTFGAEHINLSVAFDIVSKCYKYRDEVLDLYNIALRNREKTKTVN